MNNNKFELVVMDCAKFQGLWIFEDILMLFEFFSGALQMQTM